MSSLTQLKRKAKKTSKVLNKETIENTDDDFEQLHRETVISRQPIGPLKCQLLILMVGPVCSGKSTLAKSLRKKISKYVMSEKIPLMPYDDDFTVAVISQDEFGGSSSKFNAALKNCNANIVIVDKQHATKKSRRASDWTFWNTHDVKLRSKSTLSHNTVSICIGSEQSDIRLKEICISRLIDRVIAGQNDKRKQHPTLTDIKTGKMLIGRFINSFEKPNKKDTILDPITKNFVIDCETDPKSKTIKKLAKTIVYHYKQLSIEQFDVDFDMEFQEDQMESSSSHKSKNKNKNKKSTKIE